MRSSSRSVSGGAASQRLLRRYEARTAAGVGSDRRAVAQTKLIVEDDVRSSGFCHASSRPESLIFRVVRHEISLDPLDRDDPIGALLYDVNIAVSHARGIPADNAVKTPRPSYRGRRSRGRPRDRAATELGSTVYEAILTRSDLAGPRLSAASGRRDLQERDSRGRRAADVAGLLAADDPRCGLLAFRERRPFRDPPQADSISAGRMKRLKLEVRKPRTHAGFALVAGVSSRRGRVRTCPGKPGLRTSYSPVDRRLRGSRRAQGRRAVAMDATGARGASQLGARTARMGSRRARREWLPGRRASAGRSSVHAAGPSRALPRCCRVRAPPDFERDRARAGRGPEDLRAALRRAYTRGLPTPPARL